MNNYRPLAWAALIGLLLYAFASLYMEARTRQRKDERITEFNQKVDKAVEDFKRWRQTR